MASFKTILIYGEVLFDLFENGRAVLGGAPFNVAWHLQGFGRNPLFLSCVGEDAYGHQILEAMARWGMTTDFVQRDASRPTGCVEVKLDKGQPQFSILSDQAYDNISVDSLLTSLLLNKNDIPLLYHGSLALRTPEAKENIRKIKSQLTPRVFVDVNLRLPWFTNEEVMAMIQGVDWLKLNEDEVLQLCSSGDSSIEEAAEQLREQNNNRAVIMTRGAEGAFVATSVRSCFGEPEKLEKIVDTVGAGDAFSAVFIHGLAESWPLEVTLTRALQFAGRICMIRGATTDDINFYQNILKDWQVY